MSIVSTDEVRKVYLHLSARYLHVNEDWIQGCVEFFRSSSITENKSFDELCKFVIQQWNLADLREITKGCLPENLHKEEKITLNGKYSLQVESSVNVGQSCYTQLMKIRNLINENVAATEQQQATWEPKPNRMLKLQMTDGCHDVIGMEYKPIHCLVEPVIPGIKVLISGPVACRRGVLYLEDHNIKVLGGEVDSLLVPNALENLLARSLNLEENPDPYKNVDSQITTVPSLVNGVPSVQLPASELLLNDDSDSALLAGIEEFSGHEAGEQWDLNAIEALEQQNLNQLSDKRKHRNEPTGRRNNASLMSQTSVNVQQSFSDLDIGEQWDLEAIDALEQQNLSQLCSKAKNRNDHTTERKNLSGEQPISGRSNLSIIRRPNLSSNNLVETNKDIWDHSERISNSQKDEIKDNTFFPKQSDQQSKKQQLNHKELENRTECYANNLQVTADKTYEEVLINDEDDDFFHVSTKTSVTSFPNSTKSKTQAKLLASNKKSSGQMTINSFFSKVGTESNNLPEKQSTSVDLAFKRPADSHSDELLPVSKYGRSEHHKSRKSCVFSVSRKNQDSLEQLDSKTNPNILLDCTDIAGKTNGNEVCDVESKDLFEITDENVFLDSNFTQTSEISQVGFEKLIENNEVQFTELTFHSSHKVCQNTCTNEIASNSPDKINSQNNFPVDVELSNSFPRVINSLPFLYLSQISKMSATTLRIKATIITLTSPLCIKKHCWHLQALMNDGSGTIEVSFSAELLDDLIGYSGKEVATMKEEMSKNPCLKDALQKALKKTQVELINLNALFDLEFEKPGSLPWVNKVIHLNPTHVYLLHQRFKKATSSLDTS